MDAQGQIRKLLASELVRIQLKNPRFSLRSFAKKLSVSPSALSGIMAGKRRITSQQAERILPALDIDLDLAASLLRECRRRVNQPMAREPSLFNQLTMDQFHLVSDWYYFGILSLAETADFQGDPSWIARRLGISPQQAETGLQRLMRLGLLEEHGPGVIAATGKQLETSTDIADVGIRRSHRQALELAAASLEKDPVHARDFSHITMAIDPDKLPEAKRRIREFRRSLCQFLESGTKKEVFKMSVQLFPITKGVNS